MGFSPLAAAASGQRESQKLLREKNMQLASSMIARYWKKIALYSQWPEERRIEIILLANQTHQSPWTPLEEGLIVLRASRIAFGDPLTLIRADCLYQYEHTYYNSSEHLVNIEPLGLKVKQVVPGGIVTIPHSYHIGGKKSAVAGIAPQLKLAPKYQQEDLLDLTPSSFIEWSTFLGYQPSKCCERIVLWSELRQMLVCHKCSKKVEL